jgi:hypothetical protein
LCVIGMVAKIVNMFNFVESFPNIGDVPTGFSLT